MPINSPYANSNESKKLKFSVAFLVNNLFRNIFTTLKKIQNQHQVQRFFNTHIEFLKEKTFRGPLSTFFA